jgi:crotonobetainyl-CoA:carnitine CoA-transferase CaiB-like acyl-CoA transferase
MKRSFQHLKVIELAGVLAGPAVGTFFSELGAEVIKIENKRSGGDITRKWKNNKENPDATVSAYYSSVNYNKKVMYADLRLPEEQKRIQGLISDADIVISNFKAGADKKLGMDYASLAEQNPQLIYGHISGYGDDDPTPAFDAVLQAEIGLMSMNGTSTSGPLKIPLAIIDQLAGHQLKQGLLLALLERAKSERGAYVSVSLYDAALAALSNQASNWLMSNQLPQRIGSLHPNIAPYGEVFQTADKRHIIMAVGTDEQFQAMLQVLELSDLTNDAHFLSNPLRVKHRKKLADLLAPSFAKRQSNELLNAFQQHQIPAGIVLDLSEVFQQERAQQQVLHEEIDGMATARVRTAVFNIHWSHDD